MTEDGLPFDNERFYKLIKASPDYFFRISAAGVYLDFYTASEEKLYIPGKEAIGKSIYEYLPPEIAETEFYHIEQAIRTRKVQVYEYELTIYNEQRGFEARVIALDENEVVIIVRDITAKRMLERLISFQSFYDPLTSLPNKLLFQERVQHCLKKRKRDNTFDFAVLYLGIDNLQRINDSLGHKAGDELLRIAARRLKQNLRGQDTVCRVASDEFCILVEDIKSVEDTEHTARRLLAEFRNPFVLTGDRIFSSVSIGIAYTRDKDAGPEDIMRYGAISMLRAKKTGKNRFETFAKEDIRKVNEELTLQNELRTGISNNEFELYYQPILNLTTGELISFEALIRWNHPRKGVLTPYHFIDIAEENGQITEIGTWVIQEACRQIKRFQENGIYCNISVNISPRQLKETHFTDIIHNALEENQIAGKWLKIEITETLFFEFEASKPDFLAELVRMGVHICIDDFGTGFSSFAYLKRFPVDYIKIDKSFIFDMIDSEEDLILVRSMLQLASSLGMGAIAEGIETREMLELLKDEKCPAGQGYFFSRPMRIDDTIDYYKNLSHYEK